MRGRYQLPPRLGVRYVAAVDPSGGGADAFTLTIVHVEGQGAHATAGPPGPTERPTITLAKPAPPAAPLSATSPLRRDHF